MRVNDELLILSWVRSLIQRIYVHIYTYIYRTMAQPTLDLA